MKTTTIEGLPSTIIIAPMTAPKKDGEWLTRHRPIAGQDTKIWMGSHNATFTIKGYYARSRVSDFQALESLKGATGFTVIDVHFGTFEGCSAISVSYGEGENYIPFTIGVMQ